METRPAAPVRAFTYTYTTPASARSTAGAQLTYKVCGCVLLLYCSTTETEVEAKDVALQELSRRLSARVHEQAHGRELTSALPDAYVRSLNGEDDLVTY